MPRFSCFGVVLGLLAVLLAIPARADKVELQALVVANSEYHATSGLSPLKSVAVGLGYPCR